MKKKGVYGSKETLRRQRSASSKHYERASIVKDSLFFHLTTFSHCKLSPTSSPNGSAKNHSKDCCISWKEAQEQCRKRHIQEIEQQQEVRKTRRWGKMKRAIFSPSRTFFSFTHTPNFCSSSLMNDFHRKNAPNYLLSASPCHFIQQPER
eukprot:TRINITY_DN17539_c0_g1_i1.p1 TRINITY_DN17539_c0_g1~~TRINITY_DN17539_c0_g1_i1.p1  ORF type:complete len:169 (+),score=31.55 TRINITY_DN17539_c0_g1_i1:60-509(+)